MKILVDLLTAIGAATVVSAIGLVIFMIIDGRRGQMNRQSDIGVRPVFKISMRNEDTMTQDTTKKSAPEDEETVRDVLDTFNETQRLVLYYIVGKEMEGEETILDVLNTSIEKQRLVLNYLANKAAKDAKKGKTSKSKKKQ